MKKNWRRAAALLLAAAMTFSLAACGGKKDKTDNAAGETKEYVWVPQFVTLDDEASYYNAVIKGDSLYCMNYDWDETTGSRSVSIRTLSLTDGKETGNIPLKMENAEEQEGGNYSNRNVDRFDIDSQGNVCAIEEVYHYNQETMESTQQYFLCKYNGSGDKVFDQEITGAIEEDTYLQYIALDAEDRIYLSGNDKIYLFDKEGAPKGKIGIGTEAYLRSIGMDKDGTMCAVVVEYGAQSKTTLREIDFDKKDFGTTYADYIDGYGNGLIVPGLEKATLGYDGSRVYEYDKTKQTSEELLNWLDSDINGSNVSAMGALEDGRIAVITEDHDTEQGQSELVLLTKTKASEVAQKTIINLACLYENQRLQAAAVKFNKSSDTYRISIRSYYDYRQVTSDNYQQVLSDALTRLNNDITSNNCPDLLDVSSLNMTQLAAKGVFEDLTPYLEKSAGLNREDYIENILDSYSFNGQLLVIPRSFSLVSVAGKASEVGEEPGWTLEEMLAYADEHPDAAIFDRADKDSILTFLLSYNQGAFVDWETGECRFNTDAFKNLLKFANRFPDEYDWESDDDDRSTPNKIADGDVLLEQQYLYDFDSVQMAEGMFGEPVTFIGFPNDEGNSGTYLQVDGQIAITSKSQNKDGAWAFLESYLSMEKSWNDFGFSTRKSELQAAIEEATEVQYVLDENGDKLLDENGEPIIIGSGGSIGYEDGWTYEYHVTTQEEVDLLMELIDIARPVTDSDSQIMNIITEEAAALFKGDKSVDDVASVIQSRVQVYVNENR